MFFVATRTASNAPHCSHVHVFAYLNKYIHIDIDTDLDIDLEGDIGTDILI